MKLSEHYIYLFANLTNCQEHRPLKTSIQELSEILCCTKRHTKHILKQFTELQWVHWDVNPGRGNTSTLTFLFTKDEIKIEVAKSLAEKGNYQKALEQIESVSTENKIDFHQWLNRHLGLSTETKNDTELDVLRYPFYQCIKNLDPAKLFSRHDGHIVDHVFDTLVSYDAKANTIIPHIAYHWETNDHGQTWTFYLRKGVYFHHGRELTAEDVAYSINRLQTLNEPHHDTSVYQIIKEVRILRKTVVQFVLDKANFLFPYFLSHFQTSIIPIEVLNINPEHFSRHPIGTGPFKITKHDETMLVLEAFPSYFQHRPQLDRVEIITLPELYPNQNELINYWFNLGNSKQEENWKQIDRPEEGASYLTYNLNKKSVIQNKDFREALSRSLNVKNIASDLGYDSFLPAYSFLQTRSKQLLDNNNFDQKLACQLLKNCGYNGEVIQILATELRPGANHLDEANWIQEQWKKVGVNSEVHVVPIEDLATDFFLNQADILVAGIALSENLVLSLLKTYRNSTAFIANTVNTALAKNISNTLDELLNQPVHESQLEYFIRLEDLLKNEYAITFLHHRAHSVFVNVGSTLEGVTLSSNGRINYKYLWFKEDE